MDRRETASVTVAALQKVAKAFRGLPGRKSVIWASSGFPFSLSPPSTLMCEPACPAHQRDEMQSEYDNLWKMMNDAQIAIYSVDLRSTTSGTSADENTFTHPYDIGDPQFDPPPNGNGKRGTPPTPSPLLRERTGGKASSAATNRSRPYHRPIQK